MSQASDLNDFQSKLCDFLAKKMRILVTPVVQNLILLENKTLAR